MADENKRLGVVIDSGKDSDIDPELADEILRDDDNYVPRNSLGGGAADALLRANSSAPVAPNRIIGIAAMVCAVSSLFLFAAFFIPPAVVLGVIALIRKQYFLGIMSLLISIFSFFTSTTIMTALDKFFM